MLRFASRNGAPRRIHLPSPKPADRRRTLCPSNTPQNREMKKREEEKEKKEKEEKGDFPLVLLARRCEPTK